MGHNENGEATFPNSASKKLSLFRLVTEQLDKSRQLLEYEDFGAVANRQQCREINQLRDKRRYSSTVPSTSRRSGQSTNVGPTRNVSSIYSKTKMKKVYAKVKSRMDIKERNKNKSSEECLYEPEQPPMSRRLKLKQSAKPVEEILFESDRILMEADARNKSKIIVGSKATRNRKSPWTISEDDPAISLSKDETLDEGNAPSLNNSGGLDFLDEFLQAFCLLLSVASVIIILLIILITSRRISTTKYLSMVDFITDLDYEVAWPWSLISRLWNLELLPKYIAKILERF